MGRLGENRHPLPRPPLLTLPQANTLEMPRNSTRLAHRTRFQRHPMPTRQLRATRAPHRNKA